MLEDIVDRLRCPICSRGLAMSGRALRCAAGHAFDVARQGYVNLLPGGARPARGDTAAMVRARQALLGAGLLAPLADLLAERVAGSGRAQDRGRSGGCVVDVGAGIGYYLTAVLERDVDSVGVALDLSKYAAARAARAHRRIGAVVGDAWRPLPLRDAVASHILNVCAPRDGAEFHRVLRPDGALLVVTPLPAHLGELVDELGLLSVDARKPHRVSGALEANFRSIDRTAYQTRLQLDREQVEAVAMMGPSAHHLDPDDLRRRVAALPEPVEVTVAFDVSTYVPATVTS